MLKWLDKKQTSWLLFITGCIIVSSIDCAPLSARTIADFGILFAPEIIDFLAFIIKRFRNK
ncbi:MAG: hypothetical protein LBJ95_05260 [Oscillospiraceae bacterium]|jgi:hypothetical protein|nr:hypothetical protein [Oscillospiraceae bacterium]